MSTKHLDKSTNQYNLRNWKEKMKLLCARININKLQVLMILRAKKILVVNLKINKTHGMVMFVSMNAVKNSALQYPNARVQHKKRLSVR